MVDYNSFQDTLDQGAPLPFTPPLSHQEQLIKNAKEFPSQLLLNLSGMSVGALYNSSNCKLLKALECKIDMNNIQMSKSIPEFAHIIELIKALKCCPDCES